MTARIKRADLEPAAILFAKACKASRLHGRVAKRALANYGDHGSIISGCVRDHFPPRVKEQLRTLARSVTSYCDSAYASRPPRVRHWTLVLLSRDIATRDGGGFYGPRPH